MKQHNQARIDAFLKAEYREAQSSVRQGHIAEAWRHLERAHIVSQSLLWPHLYCHWRMLTFAVQSSDLREIAGQIMRLFLAPLGNLTGRLPIGNTGRSDVSAFVEMQIPSDLQSILNHPKN